MQRQLSRQKIVAELIKTFGENVKEVMDFIFKYKAKLNVVLASSKRFFSLGFGSS